MMVLGAQSLIWVWLSITLLFEMRLISFQHFWNYVCMIAKNDWTIWCGLRQVWCNNHGNKNCLSLNLYYLLYYYYLAQNFLAAYFRPNLCWIENIVVHTPLCKCPWKAITSISKNEKKQEKLLISPTLIQQCSISFTWSSSLSRADSAWIWFWDMGFENIILICV